MQSNLIRGIQKARHTTNSEVALQEQRGTWSSPVASGDPDRFGLGAQIVGAGHRQIQQTAAKGG